MKSPAHLTDPVELLYLALMLRWERTAPADGHQGFLDHRPERNTQISRMAYILKKIALGNAEHTYQTLARYTRRRDGESYISKHAQWMTEPYLLSHGWYFEGCTSLLQKHSFLRYLTHLRLSPLFVSCAEDFVAAKSVEKYMPTREAQEEICRRLEDEEKRRAA